MGKLKATVTDASVEPAVIVFGADDARKPHASWFGQADAEAAERAAGFMGMKVLRVSTAEHRAIALEAAAGRVFDSGRGFVPFCKATVLERLSAFPEAFAPPAPAAEEVAPADPMPTITGVPSRWEDIVVGSLLLAPEEAPQIGHYEAVVVEDRGESLFVLRWRDWPDIAAFVRRREDLALIYAAAVEAA